MGDTRLDSIFASSMRVTSAPVTSEKRAKSASRRNEASPKMNGIFAIPDTERSSKSSRVRSRSARPAWSNGRFLSFTLTSILQNITVIYMDNTTPLKMY